MLELIFGSSQQPKTFRCTNLNGRFPDLASVDARQLAIPGFDQKKYGTSTVLAVGSGGLNGESAEGFVRKGIGKLLLFDGDTVEPSNLNRQFFSAADIGKNKALCLAKNLRQHGYLGTEMTGYPFYLQEWMENHDIPRSDLIVCGVDNDQTRLFAAKLAMELNIPAVFSAVSRDGNQGYVFVQEPGRACFGCAFPQTVTTTESPCPNTPAIKDVLKLIAGVVLYAADTVLCDRKRNWNYRMIHLAGFMPDMNTNIKKRSNCLLCGDLEGK